VSVVAVPVADAAERLAAFVAAHGGSGSGVVAYVGRAGARVVVTAADGLFTDVLVASVEDGVAACAQAGVEVGEWTRDLTARITLSPADRVRMAGTGR